MLGMLHMHVPDDILVLCIFTLSGSVPLLQQVVHIPGAERQVPQEPGVQLHLRQAQPVRRIRRQQAPQQIHALVGDLRAWCRAASQTGACDP